VGQAPWPAYEVANQRFADAIVANASRSDLIWIHDYHLMLAPALVRAERPGANIGWYCHIPWPGPDLFQILPWRRQILEGLLGADLIGFHTETYARNFLACCEQLTDHDVDERRKIVRVRSRAVHVMVAPIGIPTEETAMIAADPDVMAHAARIRHSVNGRRIILGVDRLDYTKGIPERILGYERFLRGDRSARDRYVFVQVMVPSRTDVREYAQLKNEVDRLVGDINGRFSTTGKVAIHYLYRNLEPDALYAHYRAADVALVTPLRDGMNLVAQEYVCSRLEGDGVLVLSELAGASHYLDRAVLVNPYDIQAVADSIKTALEMRPTEVKQRMRALRTTVLRLDVHLWADGYLRALEAA
jgi:trehalose 6-phosphate synthase/phosphatase